MEFPPHNYGISPELDTGEPRCASLDATKSEQKVRCQDQVGTRRNVKQRRSEAEQRRQIR